MPVKKLSASQLDTLVTVFQAGDAGWDDLPLDHGGLRTRILWSLIDRGLIAQRVPGNYVANRALVQWRLWDSLRVPVDPAFLQEQLATVGESVDLSVVEAWTWQERRDVWAWASAEQSSVDGARRRPTRPAILLTRPLTQATLQKRAHASASAAARGRGQHAQ